MHAGVSSRVLQGTGPGPGLRARTSGQDDQRPGGAAAKRCRASDASPNRRGRGPATPACRAPARRSADRRIGEKIDLIDPDTGDRRGCRAAIAVIAEVERQIVDVRQLRTRRRERDRPEGHAQSMMTATKGNAARRRRPCGCASRADQMVTHIRFGIRPFGDGLRPIPRDQGREATASPAPERSCSHRRRRRHSCFPRDRSSRNWRLR